MVGAWWRRGGVVSSCFRVEAAEFFPTKISGRQGAVLWRDQSPLDGRGCRRGGGVVGVGYCRSGGVGCRRRGSGVGVVVVLALESS